MRDGPSGDAFRLRFFCDRRFGWSLSHGSRHRIRFGNGLRRPIRVRVGSGPAGSATDSVSRTGGSGLGSWIGSVASSGIGVWVGSVAGSEAGVVSGRALERAVPRVEAREFPTAGRQCARQHRHFRGCTDTVGVSHRGSADTRILVALEDEYRAYREVLAAGIQAMRHGAEVVTTVTSSLKEEVARFDPQVIICDGPSILSVGDAATWVKLSLDPSRPTVVHLGGHRFEQSNPTFDALLAIIDEAGGLESEEAKKRSPPGRPWSDRPAPTAGRRWEPLPPG